MNNIENINNKTAMDKCKAVFIATYTWLLSIFSPLMAPLVFVFVAFLANIFLGTSTAINKKGESFSISKFFSAFKEFGFWAVCLLVIYWFGIYVKEPSISETGMKWVLYIVLWGYATNVFKNAKHIWPKSKSIAIIYSLLSTEVFSQLKSMIGLKK